MLNRQQIKLEKRQELQSKLDMRRPSPGKPIAEATVLAGPNGLTKVVLRANLSTAQPGEEVGADPPL